MGHGADVEILSIHQRAADKEAHVEDGNEEETYLSWNHGTFLLAKTLGTLMDATVITLPVPNSWILPADAVIMSYKKQ